MAKTVREILEKLCDDTASHFQRKFARNFDRDELVTGTLSDLKKLVEDEMPQQKQGIKYKEYPMENGSHYNPTDNQKVGFNTCLTQVREAVIRILK